MSTSTGAPGQRSPGAIDNGAPEPLRQLAMQLVAARLRLESAQKAVAEDKERRSSSWWARLVDFFSTTPAEQREIGAGDDVQKIASKVERESRAWVENHALRLMQEDTLAWKGYSAEIKRTSAARVKLDRVENWLDLASTAVAAMEKAAKDCASASDTEFLDAITTSKAIALFSTLESSSAQDSVRTAGHAVQALADALPRRASKEEIDVPDDFFDLVIDLTMSPAIDILSFFNMIALDEAAKKCRAANSKLLPLLDRLTAAANGARSRVEESRLKLTSMEAPYLDRAYALVPAGLLETKPNSISDTRRFVVMA